MLLLSGIFVERFPENKEFILSPRALKIAKKIDAAFFPEIPGNRSLQTHGRLPDYRAEKSAYIEKFKN